MKRLNVLLLSLAVATFVVFNSCGDDKGGGTKNFGSQAEATAAVTALDQQGVFDMALSGLDLAYGVAAGVGGKLLKDGNNRHRVAGGFTYNASTGWWSMEETYSQSGYNYDYLYAYRFTPRDNNGNATTATDKLEYGWDYNMDGSSGGTTMEAGYEMDLVVTGIVNHRGGTGNLVFNGSSDFGFNIDVSSGGYTIVYDYASSSDYNALNWAPNGDYPASGSIDFTASRDVEPAQLEESYPDFRVAGSITFDGTNIAVLEIGGYTFHINLDTGVITPA